MASKQLINAVKFYSHVICLGTKMASKQLINAVKFYSHVICLGTKINMAKQR